MIRRLLVLLALCPTPALAATLSLRAADGVLVAAEASGQGHQGIVLVHDDGGAAADWNALRERLAAKGFPVVAVTLRGGPGARDEAAWSHAPADVTAAVAWLRKQGADAVTVVGVGLGGTVALHAAATDATVTSVAIVDPKLSTPGLKIGDDLTAYGARPLLLIASSVDPSAGRAAQALAARATGKVVVRAVTSEAHGVRLLADDPHLEGDLVSFVANPPGSDGHVRSSLAQGTLDDLETTGTKYKR